VGAGVEAPAQQLQSTSSLLDDGALLGSVPCALQLGGLANFALLSTVGAKFPGKSFCQLFLCVKKRFDPSWLQLHSRSKCVSGKSSPHP